MEPAPNRAITYIDGFNLYYGMRQGRLKRFYWLDIEHLSRKLLRDGQILKMANYFTARISGDPEKRKRQTTYVEALGTLDGVTLRFGNYQAEQVRCRQCHRNWLVPKEKQTDVAIAVAMLADAFRKDCDTMFLVSGDSDLVPPIKTIRDLCPEVRIIVAFPPNRFSHQLKEAAHGYVHISNSMLSDSLLPNPVIRKKDGFKLFCPAYWSS